MSIFQNHQRCASDCEFPPDAHVDNNTKNGLHSSVCDAFIPPNVCDDMKCSLTDNLQDNDDSNSTVADEGSHSQTFLDNAWQTNEQREEYLLKPNLRFKRKRSGAIEIESILDSKKQDKTNGLHNNQLTVKEEYLTDSGGSEETNVTESSSIHKQFVDRYGPTKGIEIGFECNFCSKIFPSRVQRNDHENSHSGKRPYQCLKCDQTFTTYSNLCTHVNLHAAYRLFKCSICGKEFVSNATLNYHTREKHLPDTDPRRYFPCELCHYKLKSYGQLDRHRQTHKENHEIFTCDYCRKQFTTKGILVQHMRIHSGIKPYKCNYCHALFRQASNKMQHERRCMYE